MRRDPLIADRVVAWLEDRYAPAARRRRRRAAAVPAGGQLREPARHRAVPAVGDRRQPARDPSPLDPPAVAGLPDRRRGPRDQAGRADRLPRRRIRRRYGSGAGGRAHLPHATPSSTATSTTGCTPRSTRRSTGCVAPSPRAGPTTRCIVRTSDHGDLLGAHGGLHQKWFNLYDEATRVPFSIARIGAAATARPNDRRRADVARRHRADAARGGGHRRGGDGRASCASRSPRCTRCPAAT